MSFTFTHRCFGVEFKKNQFHFVNRLPPWSRKKHPVILEQLEMKKFLDSFEKTVETVKRGHLLFGSQEASTSPLAHSKSVCKLSNLVQMEALTYDGKNVRVYLKYLEQRICCDDVDIKQLENFYLKCMNIVHTY
jgi:hypothetical protein